MGEGRESRKSRGRAGVPGSWTSGKKVSASERSKQVNQRHAAQNGRYPILSISAIQRPVIVPIFASFVAARQDEGGSPSRVVATECKDVERRDPMSAAQL